jgi:hypothetical protein
VVLQELAKSVPAGIVDFNKAAGAGAVYVDEGDYGEVIVSAGNSRLAEFVSIKGHPRALSITSTFSSLFPDSAMLSAGQEFLLSIDRWPSTDIFDQQHRQQQ